MHSLPLAHTHLNEVLVLPGLDEAALDRGLHVAAPEGRDLAQDPRDLDAVVEQEAQLALGGPAVLVGNQPEHVWKITRFTQS